MTDKEEEQLEREIMCRNVALKKFEADTKKNELNANASNNPYGVSLMRHYLGEMIRLLTTDIESLQVCRGGHVGAERYQILQECCGVVFKRFKAPEKDNQILYKDMFDPELACHIALQTTLCAALLPNRPPKDNKKSGTKMFNGVRPTIRALQAGIAEQLWRQMYYNILDANFSKWFKEKHDICRGSDAAKSSPHYTHNNLDWYINNLKQHCQDDERSLIFDFKKWNYREMEVIGSWLLRLTKATGLFKKVKSKYQPREDTIELTEQAVLQIDTLNNLVRDNIALPLPMLVPPTPMTKTQLGGWIGESAVLNQPTSHSWKGKVELSDLHLKFYNHQQKQAFQINPFIWQILEKLVERNEQLGKFIAYRKQPLIPMWQELEIPSNQWEQCEDKNEQDKLIHADYAKFKKVCKARSKRYTIEQSRKMEGAPSLYLYESAQQCVGHDRLYIPIEPDFRSRFTCRTSYLSYQGNDVAKGLLLFADEHKEDKQTKRFLSIHLANQAGFDKDTYSKRIDWVENNLDIIEAIAVMNSNDHYFDEGIQLLKEYGDGNEFQFAAACREYYELFIAKTKTTTNLPCAVDATCSGQQFIAGFLRSGELAERVNVLPTTQPRDIYRDTMDKMLELVSEDEVANFQRKTIKAFKGSIGRKLSKKGFMSGQYGSGDKRQLEDMFDYLANETTIVLQESEQLLIRKYWSQALEEICKIRVVFNWFKKLVQEIHDNGGTEVIIPTPTGTLIHQRYPTPKTIKIKTFSYGSSDYKTSITNEEVPSDTPNLGKWKTATAANTIHGAGDASLLCLALHDFEHPFYCVHDSIASHCGEPMDNLLKRLNQAYRQVITFDLWNEIRLANGLPTSDSDLPALSNDLELDRIVDSKYLFC